jgi:hypothetical protein
MEDQIKEQEEACWVLLARELLISEPTKPAYVEAVVSVDALVQEVYA